MRFEIWPVHIHVFIEDSHTHILTHIGSAGLRADPMADATCSRRVSPLHASLASAGVDDLKSDDYVKFVVDKKDRYFVPEYKLRKLINDAEDEVGHDGLAHRYSHEVRGVINEIFDAAYPKN